ncbi:RNA polymerase sigma factor [Polyangium mundeleinium]|uniref:Sigma-70 family RNA polymerase sigma factor n=1 Tax=Polyangium mundeleinium TaxID=2995306 RepID=A0ABT5F4P6_9BACT|nr:sigma-70 family RNA polymerase sigma factor [Polyangium mundeleinium]MDC0749059.1 sigma-70 family RNA polymerase sigma factor [Polyangium mundeleinium]
MARVADLRPDVERFLASRRKGREDGDSLEDEVQVVMTEAVASLPNYREDEGDLKSWVLGIAANIAKRAERTRQRDACLATEDGAVSVLSPHASPERIARMHELRRKVGLVLQAMPEPLFIVLYLVCIEENSHQEAAELLGITEEASRKRLQDARAYIERESGISRDELRVVYPFCVESEEEQREGTGILARLFSFFRRGGDFLTVWIIAALSWPSPSVHTARAGLSVPAVHGATAESASAVIEIAPAPRVDVPAPAPSSAKVSAKLPAARPKPAEPVETARGAAAATTDEPFLDNVADLEFRRR